MSTFQMTIGNTGFRCVIVRASIQNVGPRKASSGLTSSSLLVFRLWVGYPFGEQILPQFQGRNDAEIVCSSLIE